MTYQLIHGDCLDVLPTLEAGSIDAVVTDPPYGTTACAWDTVIPFDAMWKAIKHVVKPTAAVVLFGSQPFTSALVMSNPQWFRYQWVWNKKVPSGHLNVKIKPLLQHEDIAVFSESAHMYNRQFRKKPLIYQRPNKYWQVKTRSLNGFTRNAGTVGQHRAGFAEDSSDLRSNPMSILEFPAGSGKQRAERFHPTQKPVELLRYLIRTYTNPGDTVLDFTMGSGSTIVAAIMEGRNAIGIEIDKGYYDIACRRCADAAAQPRLLDVEPAQPTTEQAQLFV